MAILQKSFPLLSEWQHQLAHFLEWSPAIGCAQLNDRGLKMLTTVDESEACIWGKQCPDKAEIFLAQLLDGRLHRLPGSPAPLARPWVETVSFTLRADLESVRR